MSHMFVNGAVDTCVQSQFVGMPQLDKHLLRCFWDSRSQSECLFLCTPMGSSAGVTVNLTMVT